MTSPDHNTPRPPLTSGGDDDIIELTEVVDEAPAEVVDAGAAEVVLEFSPGSDLSALKGPSEPPAESAVPSPAPPEESLDDFLAALPELSEDLFVLFRQLNAQGVTVLIASHDLALIRSMGQRVLVLSHGRLVDDIPGSDIGGSMP